MIIPKSVQPGIPKLPKKKVDSWITVTMKDIFDVVENPADITDKELYTLVTVKRSRGGVERRGELFGNQIKTKTQFYINKGNFLISRRQIVHGACGIVPEDLDGAIVSNEYLVLSAKDNYDLEFIKYYTNSIYFQQTCYHSSIGIHVEKMVFKPEWWFKFKHYIPQLTEQKKISAVLSVWERAIKNIEHLLTAKQDFKKGLMQKLLTGKVRFRQYLKNDINLKSGKQKNWKMPVDWEEIRLGNIFQERNETGFNNLPLLSVTGTLGVIPFNELDRKDSSNKDKSKYKRICPGDIGYNTMRMWQGRSALSSLEGIVSPAYTICIPSDKIDAEFASYLFKTDFMIHQFYKHSQGLTSDTWNLKYHNFSRIKINLPSIDEQKDIASVLSKMDDEIRFLNKELELFKLQKKGLMQKLLTGQVRVKV